MFSYEKYPPGLEVAADLAGDIWAALSIYLGFADSAPQACRHILFV